MLARVGPPPPIPSTFILCLGLMTKMRGGGLAGVDDAKKYTSKKFKSSPIPHRILSSRLFKCFQTNEILFDFRYLGGVNDPYGHPLPVVLTK